MKGMVRCLHEGGHTITDVVYMPTYARVVNLNDWTKVERIKR